MPSSDAEKRYPALQMTVMNIRKVISFAENISTEVKKLMNYQMQMEGDETKKSLSNHLEQAHLLRLHSLMKLFNAISYEKLFLNYNIFTRERGILRVSSRFDEGFSLFRCFFILALLFQLCWMKQNSIENLCKKIFKKNSIIYFLPH